MFYSKEFQIKIIVFWAVVILALSLFGSGAIQVHAANKYTTEAAGERSIYVKNAETGELVVTLDHADRIVSKGNKIYYIQNYSYDENQTAKLCQYNVKTQKHKTLKKLTDPYEQFDLCELYSGGIYINGWNGSDNIACYKYTIESGKLEQINQDSGYVKRYQEYILMEPTLIYGDYWYYPISIYNTSSGKTQLVTEKSVGYSYRKGIVYYSECVTGNDLYGSDGCKVRIKSYSVKTGETKTLVKSMKLHSAGKITDKYVYYTVETQNGVKCYRYTIKTAKKKSMTLEQYQKLASS